MMKVVLLFILCASISCTWYHLENNTLTKLWSLPNVDAIEAAKRLEDLAPLQPQVLTKEQSTQWLNGLKVTDWVTSTGQTGLQIRKSYQFKDFRQAFWFMRLSASAADRVDHHPEWFNVYNTVDVLLTTHDVKGLSCKDIIIAYYLDQFAASAKVKTDQDLQDVFRINDTEEQLFTINFNQFQLDTKKIA